MSFFKHPANAIPPILAAVVACVVYFHLQVKSLEKQNVELRKDNTYLLEERKILMETVIGYETALQKFYESVGAKSRRAPVIEEVE